MTQTATTITVDSLPIANTIDPVQDRLLIYTAAATDIQGISRNVLLGLGSQPLGLTDSQSPQNKTFDNTNLLTIKAANLVIQDGSDTTKQVKFVASGITSGNTRSYTLPDYNATMATLAGTENLTNKTITAPVTTAISNTGGLTTNAATITGAATVGTTLGVTGNTTLGGTLGVTGVTTFSAVPVFSGGYSNLTQTIPYKFSVVQTSGQTILGGPSLVTFGSKVFDTNNNFSTSTHLFTAPVTGVYFFTFSCHTSPTGSDTSCFANLYKNGVSSQQIAYCAGINLDRGLSGALPVQLTANDTVGIVIASTSGNVVTVASGTDIPIFSCIYLGAS